MQNLTVIITFIIVSVIVGLITFFKTKETALETSDGYFLGGRSLPAFVIAGSLLLTNLSSVNFVGMSEQAYNDNMCVMGWEVCSGITLVLVALILLPRYLKQGITTIPQFIESRFDKGTREFVTVIFLAGYILNMLPITLYSGAVAMSQIFNIPEMFHISYEQGIWAMVLVCGTMGAIYAVFGGLKAVAVSDTINGILLVIGGLMVPIFGIMFIGGGNFSAGLNQFFTTSPEKFSSIGGSNDYLPFSTLFTGLLIVNLYYWGTDQAIIQRGLGAKNLKEGQKGIMIAGLLKIFTPLMLIVPGIIAFQIFGPDIENTQAVYPMVVNKVLPQPLVGIFASAMMGAILSTFDSVINSASTLFALNIYKPRWGQNKTDAQLVVIGKKFGTIIAVLSIIGAPLIMYAPKGLFDYFQTINVFFDVPVFLIVFMGYFTKRVPAIAAKIGMVFFIVTYGSSQLFFHVSVHYYHVTALLFATACLIMYVIGKIVPMDHDFVLEENNLVEVEPWENRYRFGGFVTFVMIAMYIVFSPAGIASKRGFSSITVLYIGITAVCCLVVSLLLEKRQKRHTARRRLQQKKTKEISNPV
ncbi:MAG: SSS family solute:Na+ symporter [Clostridium sp.]